MIWIALHRHWPLLKWTSTLLVVAACLMNAAWYAGQASNYKGVYSEAYREGYADAINNADSTVDQRGGLTPAQVTRALDNLKLGS